MSEKIMNVLHVIPFFIIIALEVWSFMRKKSTKNQAGVNMSATFLLLSAVGIASGFGLHHSHSAGEIIGSCYVCFGYAAVLTVVAYRIMQDSKVAKKA
ncbi:hypothetical protein [Candidatus Bandiella euplotis]|uniref:Uncharacterized protein n=1 Tax=Candidatus Bandiella euplotis TaxID=1664265 RepID=A0ABZ0ULM2_9RICK|nr:hypothetical protein [Candidatus Bandiella woodruffii]WPX96151.1 hypothetical protein Bandiella_00260 [Candidatus Bandiella woodruffii]